MYFLHIYFENSRWNGTGEVCFRNHKNEIAKWTLLSPGSSGQELLRLIATACAGTRLSHRLPFALQRLCRKTDNPLQVEFVLALHPPDEVLPLDATIWGSGIRVDGKGAARHLNRKEYRFLPASIPAYRAKTGLGHSNLFFLAYGFKLKHHDGTDDFDFSDPFFRATRFHSLFCSHAPLTDPVEFLTRLHYRAIRCKRLAPMHVLDRLSLLLKSHLAIETRRWQEGECDFRREWLALVPWQRRAVLPVLDITRHLLGGYQRQARPLDLPGFILLNRADRFCSPELFPRWVELLDLLLPQMQFLMTVPGAARRRLPRRLLAQLHGIPALPAQPEKKPARLPRGVILLLDVDSRLPNLALMKLSRYFKGQGRRVVLGRRQFFPAGIEAVYASAVFSRPHTQTLLDKLRNHYGDSFVVGGSGVDVRMRLPKEIEQMPADYSLYPELGDRAIGFITRGCPFDCPFCIVPFKEGKNRQVAALDELLTEGRRKLILLDDNILAHRRAEEFLQEMADRNVEVNFNQTLDLNLIDREKARLLKRIRCSNLRFTRRVYHFSLNDNRNLDHLRRKYQLFGFGSRDNVEFICMYGFNTRLAEDVERFRFLRSLPGAYVFVQQYLPVPCGPPPNTADFFDERADELIDQLVRIVFPQNMKSMEKYYRWVSRQYARTFGRLHLGLVDTIFRYNNRQDRGLYIASMANLRRYGPQDGRPGGFADLPCRTKQI
jgi:hypothetical protein